jgi:hypothetical protein
MRAGIIVDVPRTSAQRLLVALEQGVLVATPCAPRAIGVLSTAMVQAAAMVERVAVHHAAASTRH